MNLSATKNLLYSTIIFCILIGFFFTVTISAQIDYQDFSTANPSDFSLLTDASIATNKLRLISGLFGGGKAAAWHKTPQFAKTGFVCMFTFQINNEQLWDGVPVGYVNQHGADGFAFVIQNTGISAIGQGGGTMGYGADPPNGVLGIAKGLAIEFDTYQNGTLFDHNGNHISIHSKGHNQNNAKENEAVAHTTGTIPQLNDGNVHLVRIEYNGTTNELKVFLDNMTTPKLTAIFEIDNIFPVGIDKAFVGFTAGSGVESNIMKS